MKKIETIWHHLLWSSIQNKQFIFTQANLAGNFGYSLSTVNLAVKKALDIGSVSMSGKYFTLIDPKKLLFYWATHRNLKKDVIYKTHSNLHINELEGIIPPKSIIGGFSAAKEILTEAPADYSYLVFYADIGFLEDIKTKYPPSEKLPANIFVVKSYPKLNSYGQMTSLPQTYVDIWGFPDWYAKDFLNNLEDKFDELLSLK